MITKLVKADLLKMKRKWIWILAFLGPIGVIGLQAVNYALRYDWLVGNAEDVWYELLLNIKMLLSVTLMLGITIIASMTANIEHHQSAWKQLLALPVSRKDVYTAKFIVNILLLIVSSILVFLGTIGLGIALKFGLDFSLLEIATHSFFPLIAALPFMGLQVWLSITFHNQAFPLTVGIFASILSMLSFHMPDWVIWKWPLLLSEHHKPEWFALMGLAVGLVIFLLGMIDFVKRDVK